jgi:hypothetical protein
MPLRYASDLAPEEVFNEANQILARDRAKLGGTNYPVYKGQTISPMSSLTQRARSLQSGFNAKPAPYAGKINRVLSRPNQGINPQGQLNNLGVQQQTFNDNGLLRTLSKQFREAYEPRTGRFREKTNKDIRAGLNEASPQLQDIGRSAGILEQSSNQSFAERLRNLQEQKQARRKGLVGSLEQFGAQKHGYNNLVNAANKNAFEQEANAPFRKMDMLQDSLNPLSRNLDPNGLPELQAQSGKDALQALRAYGIDTSKPVSEWGNARMPSPSYPGKLMADLPPEILASQSTLESMSPKFKGSQYAQQKALIQQMMNNQNVGENAMVAVPARMQGQVSNLESEAQRRLKKDLAGINNQYIQSNQYGSPQHMKSAESRAREISKATLEQRNRMLQDAMKSELSLGHQQQQSNLKQTRVLGDQAQREYEDMLNKIRNTNNLGATKFGNEQAENEDLYKNFQNEANWEWPHLKGAISREARQGALGDVFRGMDNRNLSINDLAGLNTNYSESQKEAQTANRNLDTSNATIADLQRQLGVFTTQAQQQKAAQAAEAQRQAQQRQQAQQQQQAQAAEAQRLAGLRAEAERNAVPPQYNHKLLTPEMFTNANLAAYTRGLALNGNEYTAKWLKDNGYNLRRRNDNKKFIWQTDSFQRSPTDFPDSQQAWEQTRNMSSPARYINGQWQ